MTVIFRMAIMQHGPGKIHNRCADVDREAKIAGDIIRRSAQANHPRTATGACSEPSGDSEIQDLDMIRVQVLLGRQEAAELQEFCQFRKTELELHQRSLTKTKADVHYYENDYSVRKAKSELDDVKRQVDQAKAEQDDVKRQVDQANAELLGLRKTQAEFQAPGCRYEVPDEKKLDRPTSFVELLLQVDSAPLTAPLTDPSPIVPPAENEPIKRAGKNQKRKLYSVVDCNNVSRLQGFCGKHGPPRERKRKICAVECDSYVVSHNLCCKHGAPRKQCEEEGCEKPSVLGGRCWTHKEQRPCSIEGCDEKRSYGKHCIRHRPRCSVENCNSIPVRQGVLTFSNATRKFDHDRVHGGAALILRRKGRDIEPVDGHVEASPVYLRLKRIMMVYAILAFQFEVTSIYMYAADTIRSTAALAYIDVSQVVYNGTGLALAFFTGCSLPCVLHATHWILPREVESELIIAMDNSSPALSSASGAELAPVSNPVFVVRDIESSSALWAVGDGRIMQRATQIHDDILRKTLAPYRGYEITTAGDSFQLAFHTVREAAIHYLDVQMQLLTAPWPKELHGLVPATRKVRAATRVIFRGLRVRMGIHDADSKDGSLVHSTHAVTGKMTYTGAAMEIANEIGNLGEGGQILVTKRVARWLQANEWMFAHQPFVLDPVRDLAIPHVNAHLELYQLLPEQVAKRRKVLQALDSDADVFPDGCSTESEATMRVDSPQEGENAASPKITPFRKLV